MTTKYHSHKEENKSFHYTRMFKKCDFCGAEIVFKMFELYEVQNPQSWLSWKRVPIKTWWTPFEANEPNKQHRHRDLTTTANDIR